MKMVRQLSQLSALCIALATGLPAGAQDAALLQYEGPDRTEKLVAAAQKEGSLTLYTSFAEKDLPKIIEPFEKKYGIKVKVWRAGSDKVLQRVLAEASAQRDEVDAVQSAAMEMEALHREKILQPVKSPYFKNLIPGALPEHREWAATLLSVWVHAYNTNQIKKEELPKTYQDLLDPKWKGKLGIEANVLEWYSTVVLDMGEEKGVKLFRDIVARNGISARKGHSLLNNMVAAGEVPLALTVYHYMPEAAKRKGAPIDAFVLEPAIARASGLGIVRRAPHPNAALLFQDYLLSMEAQKVLASIRYVPTHAQVPSPVANMRVKLVDPKLTLDQLDKWTKSFDEVVLRQSGK